MRFYQLLTVNDNENVHLVKQDQSKMKDRRRQMASTLIRNLVSRITVSGYSNFHPVTDMWNYSKVMSKESLILSKIFKKYKGVWYY